MQSIKLITREASERCIRYAFDYARSINRPHVSVVHKANIMRASDGLFLECAREIAKEYPDIKLYDELLDRVCLRVGIVIAGRLD